MTDLILGLGRCVEPQVGQRNLKPQLKLQHINVCGLRAVDEAPGHLFCFLEGHVSLFSRIHGDLSWLEV